MVHFLKPLVDNGTGPVWVHCGTENSGLVVKGTGFGGVATGLGEENWDGVVYDFGVEGVVAGD